MKPLLILLTLSLPNAAQACTADLSGRFQRTINLKAPDQALLAEAVLRLANAERCKRGLAPLRRTSKLITAAKRHAQDMAKNNFFSHTSPVFARRTLKKRLNGIKYRRAAENIAQRNVYAFGDQRFVIKNAVRCHFIFAGTTNRVPPHSYASLAADAMSGWLKSKGHRRNILNPKLTHSGSGLAIEREAAYCGDILITQVFTGG